MFPSYGSGNSLQIDLVQVRDSRSSRLNLSEQLLLRKSSQASTLPNAKNVGQVLSSTGDAKHALSLWTALPVTRATWKSYYLIPAIPRGE